LTSEPSKAVDTAGAGQPPWDSIARGSALLLLGRIAGNAGFFVAVLILARALGPTGRGTIAFVLVTAMVLGRVVSIGVAEATTVFAADRPARRPVLLSNLLLVALTGGLLGAVLVSGALLLLGGARPAGVARAELVALALGTLATGLVEAGYAFLLGCGRIRQYAVVIASASWVYTLFLAVVWAGPGLTVARAAFIWTAAEGVRFLVLLLSSLRGIGLGRPDLPLLRESVTFGLRAWIGSLSTFLNFRTDQILMGFIATEAALGAYAVAVNASEVLLYLPAAAATALLPIIARERPELRMKRTLRAFRSIAMITAASILIAALLGPLLIPTVFGDDFDASVRPFLLLLPGAIGFAAVAVFSNALVASGSPGLSSLGPTVSLGVGLTLDLILIPAYGAAGAASAASAAFLVGGGAALGAYRSRAAFGWRELLVPPRTDLELLRSLPGILVRQVVPRR
jgi:O-antigen/teichoic acid export membrane protein